jgi:hypothetical protein
MTVRGHMPGRLRESFSGAFLKKGRRPSACGIHPGVLGAQAYDIWKTGVDYSIRETDFIKNTGSLRLRHSQRVGDRAGQDRSIVMTTDGRLGRAKICL